MNRFTKVSAVAAAMFLALAMFVSPVLAKQKNQSCPDGQSAVGVDSQGDIICAAIDACPCWDLDAAIEVIETYDEGTTNSNFSPGAICEFSPRGGVYVGCKSGTGGGLDCDFGRLWVDVSDDMRSTSFCTIQAENVIDPILPIDLPTRFPPPSGGGFSDSALGIVLPIMRHTAHNCRAILMAAAEEASCPSGDIPAFPVAAP